MRDDIWRSSLSAGRKLILFYLHDHGAADAGQHVTSTMLHNATSMSRAGAYAQLMWLVGKNILTRQRVTLPGERGPRYVYKINSGALPWQERRAPPAHQILRKQTVLASVRTRLLAEARAAP